MTLQAAIAAALAELREGRAHSAVEALRRLCEEAPASVAAFNALGSALAAQGDHHEAIATFRHALALRPGHPQVGANLGSALLDDGQLAGACAAFEQAIASGAAPPQAHAGLGHARLLLGDFAGAAQAFAGIGAHASTSPAMYSRRCYAALLDPTASAREVADIHHGYETIVREHFPNDGGGARGALPARGRLVIGYVSPNLREHSVASFLEGVLANHDPGRVEIQLYSDVSRPDATTERLAALASGYRATCRMSDEQLAAQIRADRVDVLVDLAGHMYPNRLPLFARRPARVLLSYLGYPGTTGLSVFAGRISDAWADPWDDATSAGPEPILRVEGGYFAYTPPPDAPPVTPAPCETRGAITFGCFNDALKLNEPSLTTFARVLTRVDDSRLVLKAAALSHEEVRRRVSNTLARAGVPHSRIELRGFTPTRPEHLASYAGVDVALDPFPYAGATTTCEALYMGVPVVTLAGDRHAGRLGVSVLSAAGLEDWIAPNAEDYVDLAITKSRNRSELGLLRTRLRQQLLASPLCDAARVARFIERTAFELAARPPAG